jgi:hypothetical protein
MKVKIECLPEPKLAFGLGNTGLEPRRVLAKAGPVDAGRIHEVRLGWMWRRQGAGCDG